MPTLDIFNTDAFGLSTLTAAINDSPYVPGRVGELGIFAEEGINTTTVQIEKDGETLALVTAGQRGAPGQIVTGDRRTMLPFNAIHLPERSAILADITLSDATAQIQQALADYDASVAPGDTAYKSRIEAIISDIQGVTDRAVSVPAANVVPPVDATQVGWARLGTVTVSLMP